MHVKLLVTFATWFLYQLNWACKYLLIHYHFLSCAERLNLRAASEYKYLNQSDCMTIDGVDDAKKFQRLMVYHLLVHLLNNTFFKFVHGLLRSHAIFPCFYVLSPRKHWMLFEWAKRIKSWSLRCLLQYYGWETYHSKLLTMKITLRWWRMKVRFLACA